MERCIGDNDKFIKIQESLMVHAVRFGDSTMEHVFSEKEFNGVAKATKETLEYAGLRKPAYKTLEEMRKCAEEIKKEQERISEAEVERHIREGEKQVIEAMVKGARYVRFNVSPPM
jgi:acyl-CoA reductase-like NAD-dependent aldehyde dehydrogenase